MKDVQAWYRKRVTDITLQCSITEIPGRYKAKHFSLLYAGKDATTAHDGIFSMTHQHWTNHETKKNSVSREVKCFHM